MVKSVYSMSIRITLTYRQGNRAAFEILADKFYEKTLLLGRQPTADTRNGHLADLEEEGFTHLALPEKHHTLPLSVV